MKRVFTTLAVTLLSASSTFACWEGEQESVVLVEKAFSLCEDITNSVDHLVSQLVDATNSITAPNPLSTQYWDEWAMNASQHDPFLTQDIQGNAIGLGLWLPQELADDEEMSYMDYIENQGVLLSLGLGAKSSNEPRMRIDYKWHDEYEDTVHVQLEFPIQ